MDIIQWRHVTRRDPKGRIQHYAQRYHTHGYIQGLDILRHFERAVRTDSSRPPLILETLVKTNDASLRTEIDVTAIPANKVYHAVMLIARYPASATWHQPARKLAALTWAMASMHPHIPSDTLQHTVSEFLFEAQRNIFHEHELYSLLVSANQMRSEPLEFHLDIPPIVPISLSNRDEEQLLESLRTEQPLLFQSAFQRHTSLKPMHSDASYPYGYEWYWQGALLAQWCIPVQGTEPVWEAKALLDKEFWERVAESFRPLKRKPMSALVPAIHSIASLMESTLLPKVIPRPYFETVVREIWTPAFQNLGYSPYELQQGFQRIAQLGQPLVPVKREP